MSRLERASNHGGREGQTAEKTEACRADVRASNCARREGQTADEAEGADGSPASFGFVRSLPLSPQRGWRERPIAPGEWDRLRRKMRLAGLPYACPTTPFREGETADQVETRRAAV